MSSVHASPSDAVEIFKDIQAKRAVGMHWGSSVRSILVIVLLDADWTCRDVGAHGRAGDGATGKAEGGMREGGFERGDFRYFGVGRDEGILDALLNAAFTPF
jgi:hypothetical protein